ncbi:hypothetical protein [Actinokineospora iranica]|uniref:Uncharacterized protein n=1 Tax=Actinokineospora iranica TaxID=1271860 RepID=A0A1G6WRK8_9PSEU|nr:hypothetical protein [Actinokineospora iranica]SDD68429.1 hypothetical protein SAMN05216174_115137 [Actinokineospora iranica]
MSDPNTDDRSTEDGHKHSAECWEMVPICSENHTHNWISCTRSARTCGH